MSIQKYTRKINTGTCIRTNLMKTGTQVPTMIGTLCGDSCRNLRTLAVQFLKPVCQCTEAMPLYLRPLKPKLVCKHKLPQK